MGSIHNVTDRLRGQTRRWKPCCVALPHRISQPGATNWLGWNMPTTRAPHQRLDSRPLRHRWGINPPSFQSLRESWGPFCPAPPETLSSGLVGFPSSAPENCRAEQSTGGLPSCLHPRLPGQPAGVALQQTHSPPDVILETGSSVCGTFRHPGGPESCDGPAGPATHYEGT